MGQYIKAGLAARMIVDQIDTKGANASPLIQKAVRAGSEAREAMAVFLAGPERKNILLSAVAETCSSAGADIANRSASMRMRG